MSNMYRIDLSRSECEKLYTLLEYVKWENIVEEQHILVELVQGQIRMNQKGLKENV